VSPAAPLESSRLVTRISAPSPEPAPSQHGAKPRRSTHPVCRPFRASGPCPPTQGFGSRCSPAPWAVLSRAFSAPSPEEAIPVLCRALSAQRKAPTGRSRIAQGAGARAAGSGTLGRRRNQGSALKGDTCPVPRFQRSTSTVLSPSFDTGGVFPGIRPGVEGPANPREIAINLSAPDLQPLDCRFSGSNRPT